VTVSARAPHLNLEWRTGEFSGPHRKGERQAFFPELGQYLPTPVYLRYALRPGDTFEGPAIVEERESTLVVGPQARVTVDEYGSLIATLPAVGAPAPARKNAEVL
jgi:N-methylhydantoinase A